jgi:hypothetical protein
MSAISTSGLPPIDSSQLPASVRNGTPAAKSAYQTALAFEQVLVNQLSQELASTASTQSSDGGSTSDAGSSSGSSGLIGSSDPASSMYAQLLPEALTTGIMSSGGTGVAQQIALALDPAIGAKPSTAAKPSTGAKP